MQRNAESERGLLGDFGACSSKQVAWAVRSQLQLQYTRGRRRQAAGSPGPRGRCCGDCRGEAREEERRGGLPRRASADGSHRDSPPKAGHCIRRPLRGTLQTPAPAGAPPPPRCPRDLDPLQARAPWTPTTPSPLLRSAPSLRPAAPRPPSRPRSAANAVPGPPFLEAPASGSQGPLRGAAREAWRACAVAWLRVAPAGGGESSGGVARGGWAALPVQPGRRLAEPARLADKRVRVRVRVRVRGESPNRNLAVSEACRAPAGEKFRGPSPSLRAQGHSSAHFLPNS